MQKVYPMGRMGEVEDIAKWDRWSKCAHTVFPSITIFLKKHSLTVFVASDKSSWITGTDLFCDGGKMVKTDLKKDAYHEIEQNYRQKCVFFFQLVYWSAPRRGLTKTHTHTAIAVALSKRTNKKHSIILLWNLPYCSRLECLTWSQHCTVNTCTFPTVCIGLYGRM